MLPRCLSELGHAHSASKDPNTAWLCRSCLAGQQVFALLVALQSPCRAGPTNFRLPNSGALAVQVFAWLDSHKESMEAGGRMHEFLDILWVSAAWPDMFLLFASR